MAPQKAILGIGRPSVEFLGIIGRYPDCGGKAQLRQFSIQGSGTVPTALVALAEWGYESRLIAKWSNDPFGKVIREGFQVPGFDSRGFILEPQRISPFSFVALQEGGREREQMARSVFFTEGNVSALDPEEADLTLLDGCTALLVDGTEVRAQLAGAQRARQLGIPVIFGANRDGEQAKQLVEVCDVLVASERFAAELAPHGDDVADSLRALHRMGPRRVVITMGIEGCIGLDDERILRQPIFEKIEPLDRSGAGDLFFAAVVHGLQQEWALDRLLVFATAAAGLSCQQIGARAGIPTLEETEAIARIGP